MKNNVKTMVLLILTVSLSGIFSACVPPKLISDHYNDSTPLFMPTFEYEVNTKGKVTSGDFTIGIILPSIEICMVRLNQHYGRIRNNYFFTLLSTSSCTVKAYDRSHAHNGSKESIRGQRPHGPRFCY